MSISKLKFYENQLKVKHLQPVASKGLFYQQSLRAFHFHSIAHCITMEEAVEDTI
jgi:hypothetical protein